jgi:hypothetical protein
MVSSQHHMDTSPMFLRHIQTTTNIFLITATLATFTYFTAKPDYNEDSYDSISQPFISVEEPLK